MRKNAVNSDERTLKNTGRAAAATLAMIWVALLGIGVYKSIRYGVESTTEEMLIFFGSLLIFLVLKHQKEGVDLPKSFSGKPLPTGLSGSDKAARIKAYVVDSLLNGLILSALNISLNRLNRNFNFTTIELSTPFLTILVNAVLDIAVSGTVFMLFNYFWGEHNIKKYHELLEEDEQQ